MRLCKYFCITVSAVIFGSSLPSCENPNEKKIQLLILSGRNNHDWQTTTPLLKSILEESGRFEVKITNYPDTLVYCNLKEFNAIVSNWNSWPDIDFLWPEFKNISTGAWIETTWHETPGLVKVEIENQEHPITKGLADFCIFDELWIDAERNKAFQVLGSATNTEAAGEGHEKQPAIFVSGYEEGRIFHTILGHNTRAMRNTGFKTLIIRRTEWAATSKVSIAVPDELKHTYTR